MSESQFTAVVHRHGEVTPEPEPSRDSCRS
jgi:hypothetical protein